MPHRRAHQTVFLSLTDGKCRSLGAPENGRVDENLVQPLSSPLRRHEAVGESLIQGRLLLGFGWIE